MVLDEVEALDRVILRREHDLHEVTLVLGGVVVARLLCLYVVHTDRRARLRGLGQLRRSLLRRHQHLWPEGGRSREMLRLVHRASDRRRCHLVVRLDRGLVLDDHALRRAREALPLGRRLSRVLRLPDARLVCAIRLQLRVLLVCVDAFDLFLDSFLGADGGRNLNGLRYDP